MIFPLIFRDDPGCPEKKSPERPLLADPAQGGKEQFLAGYLNSRL
jgi:hypothetical protein